MSPTLRLISGNDSIELMNATGALYAGWAPSFAPYKSVFADSAMADERRLVYQKKGSTIETISLHIRAQCQDDAIDLLRRIELILVEVRNYWTKPPSANIDPVYIKVKASNETNPRYAILLDGRVEGHGDPFAQPFFGTGGAVLSDLSLLLERGQWSDEIPGQATEGSLLYASAGLLYNYLEYDATGDYLDCGNDSSLENLVDGGFTVDGWFKVNDQGVTPIIMGLVDHYNSAGSGKNWRLRINVNGAGEHNLEAYVYGTTNAYAIGVPSIAPDQWNHITMVVNPAGSCVDPAHPGQEFNIEIMINGLVAGTSNCGAVHAYDATQDLYIGNQTTGTEGLDGDIKWVRISTGDVRGYQYPGGNYDVPEFCSAPAIVGQTIAQWEMSEGTGATVDNAQGTAALDGTITNAAWAVESGCVSFSDLSDIGAKGYVAGFDARVAITHAYRFDATGSAWSGNLIGSATPYLLFPEPVATGDYLYIGNSGSDTIGPFFSAIFDLGDRVDDGDWSITEPQPWTGAAWGGSALIGDETSGFTAQNVAGISWPLTTTWVTGNLNTILGGAAPNVDGFWVRFGATVTSAPTDSPEQHNRDIYTANKSGLIIPTGTVIGDLGASGAITLGNLTGVYDSAIIGSRKMSDGDPFVPFIHATNNVHNHSGITVSGDGADATTDGWPSGEWRTATLATVSDDDITITLDNSIAPFYAGLFRAFCLIELSTDDEVYATLSYKINNVNVSIVNEPVKVNIGGNDGDLTTVDVGTVNLSQDPDNLSQVIFSLNLSNTNAGTSPVYYLYAIALIPTDGDLFLDVSNPVSGWNSKHVGWDDTYTVNPLADTLIIDQVSSPVSGLASSVRNPAGVISGNYITSTPSGVLLPTGQLALWFLFYNREPYSTADNAAGTRYDTGPHMTNSLTYEIAQLYRIMRGAS